MDPKLLDGPELGTLGGAVMGTLVVTNGLSYAFGWQPRYVGIVVALLVSFLAAGMSSHSEWWIWPVACLNGFVIYTSAIGVSAVQPKGSLQGSAIEEVKHVRTFWPQWY
jgi:hypothetical protein